MATRPRTIVDSHVHVWEANSSSRPWSPEATGPQLLEPMTVDRLLPHMDAGGVARAVIVPPTLDALRFDLGQAAARAHPGRFATLSRPDLSNPDFADRMKTIGTEPDWLGWRIALRPFMAHWLTDGTADWFWPLAERLGQPVSILAPGQSPILQVIAERHPGLPLIIDHMGAVPDDVRQGTLAERIRETAALAGLPNVSVKLSLCAMLSKDPYPWQDLNDHIERLFDAFGPERCHWGTDLTNNPTRTAVVSSMRERVTHFTEELSFLSEIDKDWIMGESIIKKLNWAFAGSAADAQGSAPWHQN